VPSLPSHVVPRCFDTCLPPGPAFMFCARRASSGILLWPVELSKRKRPMQPRWRISKMVMAWLSCVCTSLPHQ